MMGQAMGAGGREQASGPPGRFNHAVKVGFERSDKSLANDPAPLRGSEVLGTRTALQSAAHDPPARLPCAETCKGTQGVTGG